MDESASGTCLQDHQRDRGDHCPAPEQRAQCHRQRNEQEDQQREHAQHGGVATEVGRQIAGGSTRVFGVMLESFLVGGRQDSSPGSELTYGQSITDACIGWEDTREMLKELADAVEQRRVVASRARAAG